MKKRKNTPGAVRRILTDGDGRPLVPRALDAESLDAQLGHIDWMAGAGAGNAMRAHIADLEDKLAKMADTLRWARQFLPGEDRRDEIEQALRFAQFEAPR